MAPEQGAVLIILTNGWPPEGQDVVWYGWCSAEPTTAAGGGEAAVGFVGPYRWEPAEDELTALDVATEAYEAIQDRMPDPEVATSPPAGVDAIVGVPVFVTVENWQDQVVEVRELGGDTVTVTATAELVFDPGEPGAEASTCSGPGRAYDPNGGDLWVQASALDACTHEYERRTGVEGRRSEWAASATVRWSIEWSATSGESGVFPTATRSVPIPRGVAEVQSVVVSGGD